MASSRTTGIHISGEGGSGSRNTHIAEQWGS